MTTNGSNGPPAKRSRRGNQLDELKGMTTIVADTGDIEAIRKLMPEDATTNPSLLTKAAAMDQYANLTDDAIAYGMDWWDPTTDEDLLVHMVMDKLSVNFGAEILRIVPGYVSTEVDARISFDTDATLARARGIIKMYDELSISKDRVLIKIAATYEGIQACRVLQQEGINCNMTLIFSLAQAAACAEAGATLISPFVGRIMDWHKADQGVEGFAAEEDPGVLSVQNIYRYYKTHGYKTIVMGASFRNIGEITDLAGCDRLTIAPKLLEELEASTEPLERKLDPSQTSDLPKLNSSEATFRLDIGEDPMATAKLAEGIRKFGADIDSLEDMVREKILAKRGEDKTAFEQLRMYTTIVADTGDIKSIRRLKPTDATTNPSLLFKAATLPEYSHFLDEAVSKAKEMSSGDNPALDIIVDRLSVNFGKEILGIVPGYVSTEVDARLSYDKDATLERARRIISLYEEVGIDRSRILVKLASTWEGAQACEILQKEGISCNMTLLFSLAQARACADAGATLISPFVGRIMDWHKADKGVDGFAAEEDPGVISVKSIYKYYKTHGYDTIVMGASFRNVGEILELCGCDRLTIAPNLLDELQASNEPVGRKLRAAGATSADPKKTLTEAEFRLMLNEDPMATEKLAEGIRKFSADIVKLEEFIREKVPDAA